MLEPRAVLRAYAKSRPGWRITPRDRQHVKIGIEARDEELFTELLARMKRAKDRGLHEEAELCRVLAGDIVAGLL